MIFWTPNTIYLISSAVLLLLAGLLLVNRRSFQIAQLGLALAALAAWNLCVYLVGEQILATQVSLISRIQLVAILLFGTGLFNFCSTFPAEAPGRWQLGTTAVSAGFVLGLLLTRAISDASYQAGEIHYVDGVWFTPFTLYLLLLAGLVIGFLFRAWRKLPDQRGRIRYFIAGVFSFVACGLSFNLVFPLFGNYDYLIIGRLSCTLAALFFFYAVAKQEFLDITVIINRHVAWTVTLLLLGTATLLSFELTRNNDTLQMVAVLGAALLAALAAAPLQKFLLTTAKRRFIKGWYEPDEVFLRLGDQMMRETNREAIFRKTLQTLDEVFELEEAVSVVAVRDLRNQLSGYKVIEQLRPLASDDPLILACREQHGIIGLSQLDTGARRQLLELLPTLREKGLLMPLHSPEFLEGLLVLGAKSSGADYNEADRLFFHNLLNYLTPMLYRLTPLDTLERLYNENQRKLHEAEIQLLRAQKIESIVHATRQCHHEIRTPLNIIKLGLGRIKTLDDLESYKQVAREEINNAIEIVDQTLMITDINKPVQRAQVEVAVNDVISRCLRLVDRSRYSVHVELTEVPPVLGSASDLQVVFTNLLHNAMEAMPEGGALFLVSSREEDKVVIRVEDTGHGIPDDIRTRVWEPYFSGKGGGVGNSTAGRGWGLTIVNRIIGEHGGTIQFASEVGVGTRFTITLPLPVAQRSAALIDLSAYRSSAS